MTLLSGRKPHRSGRYVWGPRRLRVGMSIRELQEATGIGRGYLSQYENGKLAVPSDHFDRVMAALETGTVVEADDLPGAPLSI